MKRFLVIGLGQLGSELAKTLQEKGAEVIAVDSDMEIIEDIKDSVSKAACIDSTDAEALNSLNIEHIDAAIVAIAENRAALDDLDSVALQQPEIDAVEPFDFAVLVANQSGPVEMRLGDRPAEAFGICGRRRKSRRVDHELFRDAAEGDARAAEFRRLGDSDLCAGCGRHARCTNTARPCANDKEIKIKAAHGDILTRPPFTIRLSGGRALTML